MPKSRDLGIDLYPHPDSASQFGQETFVMDIAFRGTRGFYVDVGARCGKTISNTAVLATAGWSGICIEPHPASFALLRANRPGATCLNVALSDTDGGTADFLELKDGPTGRSGLLSTYRAQDLAAMTARRHDVIAVPLRSLTSVLGEARAPGFIHYLDIDVEGHELQVLRGTDFRRHAFGVIGIETRPGFETHDAIVDLLDGAGYVPVMRLGADTMFMARTP